MLARWWLSFADCDNPGVCIVAADSFDHAVDRAWKLGINPGGEILGYNMDMRSETAAEADTLPLEELFDQEFMIARGYEKMTQGEMDRIKEVVKDQDSDTQKSD